MLETSNQNMSVLVLSALSLVSVSSFYYYYKNPTKIERVGKSNDEVKFQPPIIEPVDASFDWKKQKPYPYRPFKKGLYKMTLAIRKLDPNDIICIEDTYSDRIKLKQKLFDEKKLYGCHESAEGALREAYSFIFNHLTKRYPQYFVLNKETNEFDNKIMGKSYPADPSQLDSTEMLRVITSNIEEDMLILIKNPENDQADEYILRCAVSLFPAGFDPLSKMNQPLTKIHNPVPGYVQKLQTSMNKFFARLRPHEFIIRNNWSFQTHTNLCAPTGSHATLEQAETIHPMYPKDLDFNKVFFRVEKQCFTRLPKTGADIMFIRTYVTPLMDLRESLTDDETEILCSAIDGLTGDLAVYKRRIQWGEAVKAFLNKESNGSNPVSTKYHFVN